MTLASTVGISPSGSHNELPSPALPVQLTMADISIGNSSDLFIYSVDGLDGSVLIIGQFADLEAPEP